MCRLQLVLALLLFALASLITAGCITCSHLLYPLQRVSKAMPSLTELHIHQWAAGRNLQLLPGVQWPSLRKLYVSAAQLDSCCLLPTLTQLKQLDLDSSSIRGVGALAQLTGLTRLKLCPDTPKLFSAADQSELGGALAALSQLQCLRISHAPPGPVTHALSQLTALTELTLAQQDLVANPGPLVLPSCVKLSFFADMPLQHAASIKSSRLRHLDGSLTVQPSDIDTLRELCRGVLRACSPLSLILGRAWSKEDTVALMAVLSQDWQLPAEALQPSVPTHNSH
jgi:hypothetical protein